MKTKDKEKLYSDFVRLCDQIGIPAIERPILALDRQEYDIVRNAYDTRGVRHSRNGECFYNANTIYVNTKSKKVSRIKYLTKLGQKKTGISYRYKNVKPTFRDHLHTLVHELVHYRFKSIPHGLRFENRIAEILKGKTFPIE